MSKPPPKPQPELPALADSDKLSAAVERAAKAALKRAPQSLDLGDLADNAAFHVLAAWQLPKGRRSNPLKQDFFQEILFDAMIQPEEASRGIAGYLLTRRKDSALPPNKEEGEGVTGPSEAETALTWVLGFLAACAGLKWFSLVASRGGLRLALDGEAALAALVGGASAFFLAGWVWKGWRESAMASRIESAGRALASRHSASNLIHSEARSAADGCGYLFWSGMVFIIAVAAGLGTTLAYGSVAKDNEWAVLWGLGTFFGTLSLWWGWKARSMAEEERLRLEESLERWRDARHADGSPPAATS